MSVLDDLRDRQDLPAVRMGWNLALDAVRGALLAELDRLEAVTAKQVEEYPTDPKVWTAYRDALGDVRNWVGDDQ